MRSTKVSRTNVNPARMFSAGLTPTFRSSIPTGSPVSYRTYTSHSLEDALSDSEPARNLTLNRSVFWRKNRQKLAWKYHISWRLWTATYGASPTSYSCAFRTFGLRSTIPDHRRLAIALQLVKRWSGIWPITWLIIDQEIDHKNRKSSSWKSRNSEFKNVISSKTALRKPLGSQRRPKVKSWKPGFRPPRIQDPAASKSLYCGSRRTGPPYQQPQNTVRLGL